MIRSLADTGRMYRAITVTHVLEFVDSPDERLSLLTSLRDKLAREGDLFLSLRGWQDVNVAATRQRHSDGIITGIGTFTRGYSVDEASALVNKAGLVVSASPHGPRARFPKQVRFVCRKA